MGKATGPLADHLLPSSAKVGNGGITSPLPQMNWSTLLNLAQAELYLSFTSHKYNLSPVEGFDNNGAVFLGFTTGKLAG
jgi:hypothetical protein